MIRAALLVALTILPATATAAPAVFPDEVSVGLLLIAVEVRRDHLRISEALRISNAGPPARFDLRVPLPEGAEYLSLHRGLDEAVRTPDGFTVRLRVERGLTEIAYSYALATTTRTSFARAYPLPVRRMEIVARGGGRSGIRLLATRGRLLPPLAVAGEQLPRWEVPPLPAGAAVTVTLDGLPSSRPWLPAAGALGLAAVLAARLILYLKRAARGGGGVPPGPQNF